ncbi:hypothetical protein BHM03_00023602, partial [Ensete ventricosum]
KPQLGGDITFSVINGEKSVRDEPGVAGCGRALCTVLGSNIWLLSYLGQPLALHQLPRRQLVVPDVDVLHSARRRGADADAVPVRDPRRRNQPARLRPQPDAGLHAPRRLQDHDVSGNPMQRSPPVFCSCSSVSPSVKRFALLKRVVVLQQHLLQPRLLQPNQLLRVCLLSRLLLQVYTGHEKLNRSKSTAYVWFCRRKWSEDDDPDIDGKELCKVQYCSLLLLLLPPLCGFLCLKLIHGVLFKIFFVIYLHVIGSYLRDWMFIFVYVVRNGLIIFVGLHWNGRMGVLLLLITTICTATSRYRSDCTDVLFELAPCLDYVTDASNCPSLDCCKQFTNVIKTHPLCLCAAFDGTASKLLGVPIDTDRAINLPEACHEEEEEEEELAQALPTSALSSLRAAAALRNHLPAVPPPAGIP